MSSKGWGAGLAVLTAGALAFAPQDSRDHLSWALGDAFPRFANDAATLFGGEDGFSRTGSPSRNSANRDRDSERSGVGGTNRGGGEHTPTGTGYDYHIPQLNNPDRKSFHVMVNADGTVGVAAAYGHQNYGPAKIINATTGKVLSSKTFRISDHKGHVFFYNPQVGCAAQMLEGDGQGRYRINGSTADAGVFNRVLDNVHPSGREAVWTCRPIVNRLRISGTVTSSSLKPGSTNPTTVLASRQALPGPSLELGLGLGI